MSILVIQLIIKQWDKSQRTQEHIAQRADIPDRYAISFPPAVAAFNNQCVIDQHGDDLLGNRVNFSQGEDGQVIFDRFEVCLKNKVIKYQEESGNNLQTIKVLDKQWIKCSYNWRYSVFEGGFYYWLYEEITFNISIQDTLNKDIFLNSEPDIQLTG